LDYLVKQNVSVNKYLEKKLWTNWNLNTVSNQKIKISNTVSLKWLQSWEKF
jgi:hypothetical protein